MPFLLLTIFLGLVVLGWIVLQQCKADTPDRDEDGKDK